jgi:hypothetical protein
MLCLLAASLEFIQRELTVTPQVSGYPNNLHASYGSYHEAEQALAE